MSSSMMLLLAIIGACHAYVVHKDVGALQYARCDDGIPEGTTHIHEDELMGAPSHRWRAHAASGTYRSMQAANHINSA